MIPKKMRKKYFVSKELRLSIAIMLLWALLITGFFTYIARGLDEKVGSSTLMFVIIMIGYLAIVVVLSIIFSHRILGPFQRLHTELRLIISGNHQRRLNVRKNDDLSLKLFIDEVNNVLSEYERMHINRKDLIKHIDSEVLGLLSAVREGGKSPEELQDSILEVHKKLNSLIERN